MDVTEQADVLIVDDSPEARFVRRRALVRAGFTTREAGTAVECFAAIADRAPDVIILDVHLPDAHGLEVCARIKASPATQHIGVIQVSAASVRAADQVSGLEGGADAYLTEPIDPDVLAATVRAIRRERRSAAALALATERLGLAQRAGHAGLWELRPATGAAWWSDELPAVQPVPQDGERTIDAWLTAFHAEDRPRVRDALANVRSVGDRVDVESRLAGSDRRWGHVIGSAEDDGGALRISGLTIDVTARRRAGDQVAQIQDLTARLSAVARPEGVVEATLPAARATAAASGSGLVLERGDDLVLVVHREDGTGRQETLAPGSAIARRAVLLGRSSRPVQLTSRQAVRDELGEVTEDIGALCAVPVLKAGANGTLIVWRRDERGFSDGDVAALQAVAEVCAQALERAELYDEQGRIARTLQLSMLTGALPSLPAGLSAALRYLPAEAGLEVGGDWHDVIPLPDGRVAAVVGDVMGHGLTASTSMGVLRNATRALARVLASPARILRELDALLGAADETPMVTVAYVIVDPATGAVTYAAAGHPPPLVVGAGGETRFLEGGRSIPLAGLGAEREDAEDELAPGETLLLFSDGLIERRGRSIDDGLERLRAIAARAVRYPTLAAGAEEILGDLLSGNPNPDDIALAMVRRDAEHGTALARRVPGDPASLAQLRTDTLLWLDSCASVPEDGAHAVGAALDALLVAGPGDLDLEARCDPRGVHLATRTDAPREAGAPTRGRRIACVDGGELVTRTLFAPATARRPEA